MLKSKPLASGFALAILMGGVALAEPAKFRFGGAVYEKASPVPSSEPLLLHPIHLSGAGLSSATGRLGPRERASASRRLGIETKIAAREVNAAPVPEPAGAAHSVPGVQAGPIEPPAPSLHDLVAKHARANGVPKNLAAAVVSIESRFNPRARGGSALGLMQIKYATARSMGFAGVASSLMVPDTNLHFGMKVLADAYNASHGDVCMTLARYQSGHLVTHASAANRAYCARARSYMAKA